MDRLLQISHLFFALVLTALASLPAHAQDKPAEPKVVFDLEKPTSIGNVYVFGDGGGLC